MSILVYTSVDFIDWHYHLITHIAYKPSALLGDCDVPPLLLLWVSKH